MTGSFESSDTRRVYDHVPGPVRTGARRPSLTETAPAATLNLAVSARECQKQRT